MGHTPSTQAQIGVAEMAALLIEKGMYPIPVVPETKSPSYRAWTDLRISSVDVPRYFNGEELNIGVLVGLPYGLADVDCDSREAVLLAASFLPETRMRFGRESKPNSHWFYRLDPEQVSLRFPDPVDGSMLVELRALKGNREVGLQTVVPPSQHVSGEQIRYEQGASPDPANCDADELIACVRRLASASLFAKYFPEAGKGRHRTELALAGTLRRAHWHLDDASDFVAAIYRAIKDPDPRQFKRGRQACVDTWKKGDHSPVTGVPTLSDHFPKKVLDKALEWLGIHGERTEPHLCNDAGNADRLVETFGEDLRYNPERDHIVTWVGTHWKTNAGVELERKAEHVIRNAFAEAGQIEHKEKRNQFLNFLTRSLQQRAIRNMIQSTRRKLEAVEMKDFDSDPCLLNCENGTIDLRTGRIRPHRREDLITTVIPIQYSATAMAPVFQRFLRRIMGERPDGTGKSPEATDRLVAFLQTAFGWAATGLPGKVLFVLHGSGNNGKTTLVETIRAALGGDAYCGEIQIESLLKIRQGVSNAISSDMADLRGKRFVTSSEIESGQHLAKARVKYLTGQSQIKARYLHENWFAFNPSHKLFLDCNNKPVIDDSTDAIWNRVKLIPFDETIPPGEIDPELRSKLMQELSGILRWIVVGAVRYFEHGLPEVPEVGEATAVYRNEFDSISQFITEMCVVEDHAKVGVTDIWSAFETWSENNGIDFIPKKREFQDRLSKLGARKTSTGKVRIWQGIGLTPASDNLTNSDSESG